MSIPRVDRVQVPTTTYEQIVRDFEFAFYPNRLTKAEADAEFEANRPEIRNRLRGVLDLSLSHWGDSTKLPVDRELFDALVKDLAAIVTRGQQFAFSDMVIPVHPKHFRQAVEHTVGRYLVPPPARPAVTVTREAYDRLLNAMEVMYQHGRAEDGAHGDQNLAAALDITVID